MKGVSFVVRDKLSESRKTGPRWVKVSKYGEEFQLQSGDSIELFKIKTFADAMGKTTDVVKEWHRRKLIPVPLFALEGRQCKHWYSGAQILNCQRIWIGRYNGAKTITTKDVFLSFMSDLRAVWYEDTVVINEKGERL